MCGIAGFHFKDPEYVKAKDYPAIEVFTDTLLEKIEMRGKQATGFAAVTVGGKEVTTHKEAMNAADFVKIRKRVPENVRTVLLHTRYATQGSNENRDNLHPVVSGTCFATHNGMISNDDELFKKHSLDRYAEVDTEIIPALINKYGWDDAKKALGELFGSFAIAAIDPINKPDELLLAKGDGSPLFIHETSKIIVWASSGFAIRDAWGKVVGTPPDWNKLLQLKGGDMVYVRGGDVEVAEFEPARRPFVGGFQHQHAKAGGGGANAKNAERSQRSTRHPRGSVNNRRTEVSKLRYVDKAGIARVWPFRDRYDHAKMLKDGKGGIIWIVCGSCQELVFDADFALVKGEGRLCLDCHALAAKEHSYLLDEKTKGVLERWCAKEAEAHRLALDAVEHQTGISSNVVDYLVFRVAESYTNEHPTMRDICDKLDTIYQHELTEAFDALLDEHNDEANSLDDAFKEAVEKDDAKFQPETCSVCKRFKSPDAPCRICTKAAQKQKSSIEATLAAGAGSGDSECWCGKEATAVVGRLAAYCDQHYDFCNVSKAECKSPEYPKNVVTGRTPANHLRTDGKRVCHWCSRGEKGVWSDKKIGEFGVNVERYKPIKISTEPGGL